MPTILRYRKLWKFHAHLNPVSEKKVEPMSMMSFFFFMRFLYIFQILKITNSRPQNIEFYFLISGNFALKITKDKIFRNYFGNHFVWPLR